MCQKANIGRLPLLLLLACSMACCTGVLAAATTTLWKLPTPDAVQGGLELCSTPAGDAAALRCVVAKLGLWTDEAGYNAKRIAKMFAQRNQTEELLVIIKYCNEKHRQPESPENWAYQAYKCATVGRFGHWINDYMNQQQGN